MIYYLPILYLVTVLIPGSSRVPLAYSGLTRTKLRDVQVKSHSCISPSFTTSHFSTTLYTEIDTPHVVLLLLPVSKLRQQVVRRIRTPTTYIATVTHFASRTTPSSTSYIHRYIYSWYIYISIYIHRRTQQR